MAGNTLQPVYVARTLEVPQKRLETFLGAIARPLGRGAIIYNPSSTHLTFLESEGVKDKFYAFGYTPENVKDFQGSLQRFLDKKGHGRPADVTVDQSQILRWVGKNKIAVNLVNTPELEDQRGLIEEFTKGQLGEIPELRPFEPHITIGELRALRRSDIGKDPSKLVPRGAHRPGTFALNGLEVYVGAIHKSKPHKITPEAVAIEQALTDFDGLDPALIGIDPATVA